MHLAGKSRIWKQTFPRTGQRPLYPRCRRDQDIDFARFDFLNRADVYVHKLGELFVSDPPCRPLSPHVRTKPRNFGGEFSFRWHAPLRRHFGFDRNGPTGRKTWC